MGTTRSLEQLLTVLGSWQIDYENTKEQRNTLGPEDVFFLSILMIRGEAGILRTDLWSLGNNARAFWKIWEMTGADYSAPVRGIRMAEGKMSPPPPPPRFKTLRRLCSVNGKQFENSTFQSEYLF